MPPAEAPPVGSVGGGFTGGQRTRGDVAIELERGRYGFRPV